MQMGTTVPLLKKMIRTIFDKTGVSGRLELALFVVHHQVLAHAAAEQHLDFPALPALTPRAPSQVQCGCCGRVHETLSSQN